MSLPNWIQEAIELGDRDKAIMLIYKEMDDLLIAENVEECDRIFKEIDVTKLPPVLAGAFLVITFLASPYLNERLGFFNRVMEYYDSIGCKELEGDYWQDLGKGSQKKFPMRLEKHQE